MVLKSWRSSLLTCWALVAVDELARGRCMTILCNKSAMLLHYDKIIYSLIYIFWDAVAAGGDGRVAIAL